MLDCEQVAIYGLAVLGLAFRLVFAPHGIYVEFSRRCVVARARQNLASHQPTVLVARVGVAVFMDLAWRPSVLFLTRLSLGCHHFNCKMQIDVMYTCCK
jgi:hypothetical protein